MTMPEPALAFLQADPLRHLPHLKYLHLYADAVTCFYTETPAVGLLLSHAPELTAWDKRAYAAAHRIFLPVAQNSAAAEVLCQQVSAQVGQQPFVAKFGEVETREVFAQHFHLQPVTAFISYTTDHLDSQPIDNTIVGSHNLDENLACLYRQNGYSDEELTQHFAHGAQAFTSYQGAEAVCSCLIYPNFGKIWEIGAVHTLEQWRRQGLARRVVTAALSTVLERRWIPRYQVEASNLPSIRLAESLGLQVCLRFEHAWGNLPPMV